MLRMKLSLATAGWTRAKQTRAPRIGVVRFMTSFPRSDCPSIRRERRGISALDDDVGLPGQPKARIASGREKRGRRSVVVRKQRRCCEELGSENIAFAGKCHRTA